MGRILVSGCIAILICALAALWSNLRETRQELEACRAELGAVQEQKEMLADAMKARREADVDAQKRTSETEKALDRNRDWAQCPLPDDIVRSLNEACMSGAASGSARAH